MTITKEAVAQEPETSADAELEAINQWSKIPLTAKQVYHFGVRLCDNQVDRDEEYFDRSALDALAGLFVGKSGIFDHAWSAKNQTARIYRTEVVPEGGVVEETGEASCYLKGYAYMLRTASNADLIAEIEGGIKKEVSVSCAVSRTICSICGNDVQDRTRCSHVKGRVYEGKRCIVRLDHPTDAYEWSFVAVPAQKQAGVMKHMKHTNGTLKDYLATLPQSDNHWQAQLERLEKEAACGRKYLKDLRRETVRLGLMAESGMSATVLGAIVEKLEEPEIRQLKQSYESAVEKRFPTTTQLRYPGKETTAPQNDHAFLI